MKKKFILFHLLCVLALGGCDDEETPHLSVSEQSIEIAAAGGEATPVNLVVTQAASEFLWQLSANKSLADFTLLGGSFPLTITGTAPHWTLTSDADWVQLSQEEGASGSTSVNNAIRIPCSWNQHLENHSTAKIKIAWLNRVKQVVQWCVDNDMYVILNIHWDGGWLENNCTTEKQFENNAKQKALWEQIATHLRDFDERLMFAGTNEPNVENASQMAVLQSYLQTFVDAVRATGGRNHYRTLVVQGPSTDVERTFELMSDLPVDVVSHRMMAEIHFYTPFQFCLMSEDANWGKMFYYWGRDYHSTTDVGRNATWGEEARLDELMAMMKQQFVDKGIPVVLGEYAVIRRNSLTGDNLELHLASRAHYLRYLTQKARSSGLLPFYWDAGNMGNNASALFNRRDYTVYDQVALDAIMEGVNNIQQ